MTIACAPLLLMPLAAHAAGPETPEAFGQLFCKASVAGDMAEVEANLTPWLAGLIAEARARNAAAERAFPDEKPPLGDGLPWRSWQDYADGCAVGPVTKTADRAGVEIRYSFASSPDANYTDKLVLVPSNDTPSFWQLDDIELIDQTTMRTNLAAALPTSPSN
ncbi:hypothetical protein VW35_06615 [Devosia soli]|uniref:DUF3828 domain-containing protein n=1 Tax=Devosia soli TaxID=361041 RepID=A0A0F5LCL0_9HYPH|nr:hypothetical protein [Devosia soli]KKB80106.1 hypothetical protein VW35_06615 [Devosia soli]